MSITLPSLRIPLWICLWDFIGHNVFIEKSGDGQGRDGQGSWPYSSNPLGLFVWSADIRPFDACASATGFDPQHFKKPQLWSSHLSGTHSVPDRKCWSIVQSLPLRIIIPLSSLLKGSQTNDDKGCIQHMHLLQPNVSFKQGKFHKTLYKREGWAQG